MNFVNVNFLNGLWPSSDGERKLIHVLKDEGSIPIFPERPVVSIKLIVQ